MFQPQFCLLHFASIPTFFACRTASFLVFYIPPKNIYGIDDCLKKEIESPELLSTHLINPRLRLGDAPSEAGVSKQRLPAAALSRRLLQDPRQQHGRRGRGGSGCLRGRGHLGKCRRNPWICHCQRAAICWPINMIWRFACYNHDVRWFLSSLSVCILPSGTPTWKWGSSDCPGRDLEGSDCWLVLGLYLIHFTGI